MTIDSNILIFPDDEQELIDMYFDETHYRSLKERYEACCLYVKNKLSTQEKNKFGLSGADATQIAKEIPQLRKRIFHAALHGFMEKVCERQILICEQSFSNESDSIPLPDIYDKDQYFRLESWWQSLSEKEQIDVAKQFQNEFGIPDKKDNQEDFCKRTWVLLSLEDQENIYDYYNKDVEENE